MTTNEINEILVREIKPCPICGKYPKIKRDYGFEGCGFGAWCTIQCKPLFRKPHLCIEEGKASWDRALRYAVFHWNEAVEEREAANEN